MENRRENYRHRFPAGERIPVRVQTEMLAQPVAGEMVSLSAGGMGVFVPDRTIYLTVRDRVMITFQLPDSDVEHTQHSAICHSRILDKGWHYGCQFLPMVDSKGQADRERMIWKFLMDQQRRTNA